MKNKLKLLILIVMIFNIFTSNSKADNPLDTNWRDYFNIGVDTVYKYGLNDDINCIYVNETNIFIGGEFTWDTRSMFLNHLGLWNDSTWIGIGTYPELGVKGKPFRIYENNNKLYIGGRFDSCGDLEVNNIICWDKSSSSFTPSALNHGLYTCFSSGTYTLKAGMVKAITGNDSLLYIGGAFGTSGDTTLKNLAVWDGVDFFPVSGGTNGLVNDLVLDENYLYVCGAFDTAGTTKVNNLGMYDINSCT